MKKLLILLFSLLISFASSSGASDEPTRYVYDEFNIDNASKYTISTGSMHEFSCLLTQIFFSQEALTAAKNKKKFDFMNSDFTPTVCPIEPIDFPQKTVPSSSASMAV